MNGYVSNTLAANGNQSFFTADGICTGMTFAKVFKGGKFPYAFAFSNVIDSTFADGSTSKCNDVCDYRIVSLNVAVTDDCIPENAEESVFTPVTFCGEKSAEIGRLTFTDEIEIEAEKDKYLCFKIEFEGRRIPCHKESIVAIFRNSDGEWQTDVDVPLPVFTGVKRDVKKKIAFLGDSITQGIGSEFNSYKHYAACTAEFLGDKYAYWDLGLGYARGADAATDGIWLEKLKQNDIVTVCFGVNDMFQSRTEEQLKADLKTITEKLKAAGAKVILQTVPPFDYDERYEQTWRNVNEYIKTELAKNADVIFDNNPVLCDGEGSTKAKYGGHPNNEGYRLWAEALAPVIKELL